MVAGFGAKVKEKVKGVLSVLLFPHRP